MLKNRETSLLLLALAVLGAAGTVLCFVTAIPAGFAALAFWLLSEAAVILYLRWRNRRVRALSDYLSLVTAGVQALPVLDNEEGELSILRSEIFKVTGALREQALNLSADKQSLLDAISDISHQLKTPLTSVSMMTDLLERPDLPPERQTCFLQNIRTNLTRVEWLVSALLKLARLDADAVRFSLSEVGLAKLIRQAAAPLEIQMELKDIGLHISGEPSASVSADEAWLLEAVTNILKNCVHHTPEGGSINVSLVQNALYTALVIHDTGPGIPKKDLPHIFERFYRGENAGADSVGIGLALASAIVRSMKGSLDAGNAPEGGAVFTMKFYSGDFLGDEIVT